MLDDTNPPRGKVLLMPPIPIERLRSTTPSPWRHRFKVVGLLVAAVVVAALVSWGVVKLAGALASLGRSA